MAFCGSRVSRELLYRLILEPCDESLDIEALERLSRNKKYVNPEVLIIEKQRINDKDNVSGSSMR